MSERWMTGSGSALVEAFGWLSFAVLVLMVLGALAMFVSTWRKETRPATSSDTRRTRNED